MKQKDIRTMLSNKEPETVIVSTQNVGGGANSKVSRVSTPVRTKVQRFEALSK